MFGKTNREINDIRKALTKVRFKNHSDAEKVLLDLRGQLDKYGMVSVSDYYDIIGHIHPYTVLKYGWKDLKYAAVMRAIDGYYISFPKFERL